MKTLLILLAVLVLAGCTIGPYHFGPGGSPDYAFDAAMYGASAQMGQSAPILYPQQSNSGFLCRQGVTNGDSTGAWIHC